MSNAYLSPLFQDSQWSDNALFLTGGLLWSYAAGTTAPLTAWQDSGASVAWDNPIVLNSRGETGGEIWLSAGKPYKFVLETAPLSGNTHGTVISDFDNVTGVNDPSANPLQADWIEYTVSAPVFLTVKSFSLTGDVTAIFTPNRRFKAHCTAGLQVGTVSTSTFDGTKTTVVAIMDVANALDNGMSDTFYGFIETDPYSIPVPVITGTSTTSNVETIKVGWDGTNLTCTVDTHDYGADWPINIRGSAGPTGSIIMFASNTAPAGYLKANGAEVSRTTYSELFAVIGTVFGAGDGVHTFNLPEMRGYFARGWDDGHLVDTGRVFGSTQADENAPISLNDPGHTHPDVGFTTNAAYAVGALAPGTSISQPTSSAVTGITINGSGTESRPKNVALLACIKF